MRRSQFVTDGSEVVFVSNPDEPAGYKQAVVRIKGGPGSGNFGHEGRPGEVGGSATEGGEGGNATATAEKPSTRESAKDEKNRPPKPSEKNTKPIADNQNKAIKALASKMGVTQAKLMDDWDKAAQSAVEKAKVYVRCPSDVLEDILYDGRIKSQFETGTAMGGDVDPEGRSSSENNIFGTPKNTVPEDRPIYGYASEKQPSNSSKGDNHDSCRGYGRTCIELKDSVRDRSTVTFTDSLNASDECIPSPMTRPSFRSAEFITYGDETPFVPPVIDKKSVDAAAISVQGRNSYYTEVQVHHGVRTSDIAKVWMDKRPGKDMQVTLKGMGIPWEVMK